MFKNSKLVLIQAEFKVVGREALLVIDERVIVQTGAPPFPFSLTWFTGKAEVENYINKNFIYFKALQKEGRMQEWKYFNSC